MKWYDRYYKIKSYEICKSEADKTKGNWFIYELSNGFYDSMEQLCEERRSSRLILKNVSLKNFH